MPMQIPILTYHQIDETPPYGTPFRSLVVSPASFARQMAWLRLLGYQGLSMSALLPYLQGKKTGKVVGITLDDGYRNNLDHALPVLHKNGFSSTCYMVSGQLGGTNVWDAALGVPAQPLMNKQQLRAWVAGGQEVGSHTCNHVDLSVTPTVQVSHELANSRQTLENLLDTPVQHFCYPYGRFLPEHLLAVRNAGYLTATTTQRSRVSAADDVLSLPRVPVLRSTTLAVLWLKLATAYEDRRHE
jgi:peptidoglycan/xylan/chitin deacetylase (PgdA/CDA1 family)